MITTPLVSTPGHRSTIDHARAGGERAIVAATAVRFGGDIGTVRAVRPLVAAASSHLGVALADLTRAAQLIDIELRGADQHRAIAEDVQAGIDTLNAAVIEASSVLAKLDASSSDARVDRALLPAIEGLVAVSSSIAPSVEAAAYGARLIAAQHDELRQYL